ncbi:MAG TPA: altronate dehydrogenase [Gemmataceae bacterium]|jgi:tagaturonate reductase|nr:altronate dehydrogenase [Gemmataceae bacterium]
MTPLPETVLQFGAGRFLRAFADLFIHHANVAGQHIGRVAVVQSTGDDRAGLLNQSGGKYHVVVRGLECGQTVDRVEEVASISRALVASQQWDEILMIARSPDLRFVLSNTTEAGYNLDPTDQADSAAPKSFPAKLLAVLKVRFDAGKPGLTIIPCELQEHQADKLLAIVLQLAQSWKYPADFANWLQSKCVWLHTLVDRIVVGPPKDHPFTGKDPLLIMAEPFAFWALQDKPGAFPFVRNPAIVRTPNVQPYFLRKVRILNGAHSALLIKARPRGFVTVREAMNDPVLSAWLERLLFEEIVPTLEGRVDGPNGFAKQTLERFRNPFLEHKLSDIAQHHESKVKVRLIPTQAEFRERFGRNAPLLDEVLKENVHF